MGQKFLIDTNIIIDNIGGKLHGDAKDFVNKLELIISAVTKIEILGWPGATKEQLKPLYSLINIAEVLPITDEIIDKTISIRQNKKTALGDAIIAATAIVNNLTLITRNVKDFKNITELKILNPNDLK